MADESLPKSALERPRLLVVDDDAAICRSYRRMFSSGYDVEMEQSAVAALERIGAGERFDVVISDLSMPVMSGAELHVRVQAIDSQQADRMLFVTGSGYDEFSRTFLAGLTGRWLQKPFDANALRALVAQLAASRRV